MESRIRLELYPRPFALSDGTELGHWQISVGEGDQTTAVRYRIYTIQ